MTKRTALKQGAEDEVRSSFAELSREVEALGGTSEPLEMVSLTTHTELTEENWEELCRTKGQPLFSATLGRGDNEDSSTLFDLELFFVDQTAFELFGVELFNDRSRKPVRSLSAARKLLSRLVEGEARLKDVGSVSGDEGSMVLVFELEGTESFLAVSSWFVDRWWPSPRNWPRDENAVESIERRPPRRPRRSGNIGRS